MSEQAKPYTRDEFGRLNSNTVDVHLDRLLATVDALAATEKRVANAEEEGAKLQEELEQLRRKLERAQQEITSILHGLLGPAQEENDALRKRVAELTSAVEWVLAQNHWAIGGDTRAELRKRSGL